jgi:hypothetical protein
MFATILRRWRIVTPVVTAMVTLSLVVSAFVAPASAHTLKFAFSGDAADFINYSTSPAYFDCFSGWLSKSGAEINSLPLSACVSPGFDVSPTPGELSVSVFADVARWDLVGSNSSTGGHTSVNSEVFGENDNTSDGAVERLDNVSTVTFKCDRDNIANGFCTDGKGPNGKPNGSPDQTGLTVTVTLQVFSDPIVSSLDVYETAYAHCQKNGNHGEAGGHATVSFDHLKIVNSGVSFESENFTGGSFDGTPDTTGNSANYDVVANAAGAVTDSVQIVRSFTYDSPELIVVHNKVKLISVPYAFEIIVTTNDNRKWVNGNTAAVTGDGLHVILQTEDGQIASDVVWAHAHADIECGFSLHCFNDPFGL